MTKVLQNSSESKHIRLDPITLQELKEYQDRRRINNESLAIRQLIHKGCIWDRHMIIGGGKPYSRWYREPDDFTLRTWIDDLTDEERDRMLLELTRKYVSPAELKWLKDTIYGSGSRL